MFQVAVNRPLFQIWIAPVQLRNAAARSSAVPPADGRVVAILDFMAEHPHDRFGLSELARHVGLAKPTCLGIVTTLTESGYLVRDSGTRPIGSARA